MIKVTTKSITSLILSLATILNTTAGIYCFVADVGINDTELEAGYFKGDFKQHFTIIQQMRPLPFTYLTRIILDDPRISDQDDILIYRKAIDRIQKLMNANNINATFVVRKCPAACGCFEQYANAKKGYIWHKFGFKE